MEEDARLFHRRGTTEQDIAEVLLRESPSPAFLRALAWALNPPERKKPMYKMTLAYRASTRPKGSRSFDENALVDDLLALDASGKTRGQKKPLRDDILRKYGVSSRTASEAIRRRQEVEDLWAWLQARTGK